MPNSNNLKELKTAIDTKQAELDAIPAEKEAAADDAAKYATIEKKESRLAAELKALQEAYQVGTAKAVPLTDQQQLLVGLTEYEEQYNERLRKIRNEISDAEAELNEIEDELNQAASEGDTKRTIKLANRKEELTAQRKQLIEMLQRAEAFPVYPEGIIEEQWQQICERLLPDWKSMVLALRTAADAYLKAVDELQKMHDLILSTRSQLEVIGRTQFQPFFTDGNEYEDLLIEKAIKSQVVNLFRDPVSGPRRI